MDLNTTEYIGLTLGVTVIAKLTEWGLKYFFGDQKSKKEKKRLYNHSLVQEILNNYLEDLDADRAMLFQCHNGGTFFGGKSIYRFSVTCESIRDGIAKNSPELQNQIISIYSQLFKDLFEGDSVYQNVDDITDPILKSYFFARGVESAIYLPVFVNKQLLAFYCFEWNSRTKIEKDKIALVQEISDTFVKLI